MFEKWLHPYECATMLQKLSASHADMARWCRDENLYGDPGHADYLFHAKRSADYARHARECIYGTGYEA